MLVTCSFDVEVFFADDEVWERCVNNTDNWQGTFYPLTTKEDVAEHLAYNFIANGIDKINRLEGWADLKGDEAEFRTIDYWQEVKKGS